MKLVLRHGRLIAILAVLLIGVSIAYVHQTKPDLLRLTGRMRRVLTLDSGGTHTWWLTEHELLVLRGVRTREQVFARYNIDSNTETTLTALTEIYRNSGGNFETLRPSPNGDWVLWTGNKNATYVTTLDGRRRYQVPEADPRCNVWNYSGTGWYALNLGYETVSQATEHDLDAPVKNARSNAVAFPFRNDPNVVDLDHITPKSATQLIVPVWKSGKGKLDEANIVLTGLGASPSSVNTLKIPAPYPNMGGALAFSALSDQMAWQLDVLLPEARFWNDLGFPTPSQYHVGFFVTDHSGRNLSYGYLDADRKDRASRPTDLQFSPGGTYFSFVLRKALWIVPTQS